MQRFASKKTQTGAVFQAGIPFVEPTDGFETPFLVRAVVMRTFAYDDPNYPFKQAPTAVYCDCLVYTQMSGGRHYPLYKVLVSQEQGGMHKGKIWIPKASDNADRLSASGNPDIMQLTGDHVLVGFTDSKRFLPVIIRGLPHPNADHGNQDKPPGQRMQLRLVDGSYDMSKHNGVFYGVDNSGNHSVNTVNGNLGGIGPTLQEIPGVPGVSGNQTNTAPAGASIKNVIADSVTGATMANHELKQDAFNVTFSGSPGGVNIVNAAGPLVGVTIGASGQGNVVLGNGTDQAVDNVKLMAFINTQIEAIFNTHVHTPSPAGIPFGGPPAAPMSPATPVTFANNSVKVPTS